MQDKILPVNVLDKVLNVVSCHLIIDSLFFITSSGVLAAASGGFSANSRARWHLLRCRKGCDFLMSSVLKLKNVKQLLHFPLSGDLCVLPLVCCRNGPDTEQLWAMLAPKTNLWHSTSAGTREFLTFPGGVQLCPGAVADPSRGWPGGPGSDAVPGPAGGGRACAPAVLSVMRRPAGLWRGNGGAGGRLCRDARGLSRSAWSFGSRLLEPLLGPSPRRSGGQRDPQFERQEASGLSAGQCRQPRSQRHHPGWWGTGREGGEAAGNGSGVLGEGLGVLAAQLVLRSGLSLRWPICCLFVKLKLLSPPPFALRPSSPRLRQDGGAVAGFFLSARLMRSLPFVGFFFSLSSLL